MLLPAAIARRASRIPIPLAGEIGLSGLIRVGMGREAEVFVLNQDWVLRLAFSETQREQVMREAAVLRVAHAAGAPVPALDRAVTVERRPGLVIERLAGPDLLGVLGARPWLIASVAGTLGRIHAGLHDITAPDSLPPLRDELRRQLGSSLVPDDVRLRAERCLDRLPDGDRLCHRDLHPGNVLCDGARHVVIDWSQSARGAAAADVARTRLLLAQSALPDGMSLRTRLLARSSRRILAAIYLRAYQRAGDISTSAWRAWTPVLAAARLAEGIEAERSTMLALARVGQPMSR
jgi:Ser/Thr protein kinase RdoA (MazF antagonist)